MRKNILCLLTLLCCIHSFTIAQWNDDPAVNTPVCTNPNSEVATVKIISDDNNGSYIAWMDKRNGYWQIYAQHLDKSGFATWPQNGIRIAQSGNSQYIPLLVKDNAGGIIVTWQADLNSGVADIYAQHIDITGKELWQKGGLPVCTAPNQQSGVSATTDEHGGVFIAWHDGRAGNNSTKVYVQHIDETGTALFPNNGLMVCNFIGTQSYPAVLADGKDGLFIAWTDSRNNGFDIYAQHLDKFGQPLLDPVGLLIRLGHYTKGTGDIKLCHDASDGFLIFWGDAGPEEYQVWSHIYAQRITFGGAVLWQKNGISILMSPGEQDRCALISTSDGGAILAVRTWTRDDQEDSKVVCQRIDENGNLLWGATGKPMSNQPAIVVDISILSDNNDGAFVSWSDNRSMISSEDGFDEYIQHIDGAGNSTWTVDGLIVCNAPGYQGGAGYPVGMADNTCGPIMAWIDQRVTDENRLYAARVTNILKPSAVVNASSTNICAGTPVTFDAVIANAGKKPAVIWKKNDVTVQTGGIRYTDNALADNDRVFCIVTNTDSCAFGLSSPSDTVVVKVGGELLPTINISADASSVCAGSIVTFKANTTNTNAASTKYQWQINGKDVGSGKDTLIVSAINSTDVITCMLITNNSCNPNQKITSAPVSVNISPLVTPAISIIVTQTTFCPVTTITFGVQISNAGNKPTFQWNVNQTQVGTTSQLTTSALVDGDKVFCTLVADPSLNCVTTSSINSNVIVVKVTPNVSPAIAVTSSKDRICEGETVAFTASLSGANSPVSYQWKLNNLDVGANSNKFTSAAIVNGDDVYCVATAVNNCGNVSVTSNHIKIQVADTPIVVAFPRDTLIHNPGPVQLRALVTGNVAGYQWDPAGSLSNTSTLTPLTKPIYTNTSFSIKVVNSEGCSATAMCLIRFNGNLPIALPSAFTPNGDGHNDYFRVPPQASITLERLSVYDRWGHLVFTTKDVNKGWDGMVKNHEAAAGAYIYYLTGSNAGGPISLRGTVVLIR